MTLSTGTVLNNRYRIVNLVGQGGFGAVYRAWDTTLHVPVALKENLDSSPAAQHQFELEAMLLAKLSHPSLPRVTDHFLLPPQGQYLVMDFVEGKSLNDLLIERGGPLPEAEVRPWIEQICSALDYLHSRQPPVIHRDIKPHNIIIAADGQAKLVDFGISKVYDAQRGTTAGARGVTPGFSPPEQYGTGRTDARSDIYALGATLYTLLTGQEPPESVHLMSGLAAVPSPRAVNPAISPAAEGAILAALNPNHSQRLASAAALRDAWDAPPLAAAGRSTAMVMPTRGATLDTPAAPARPSRLWLFGGLAVALLALAAALFLWPDRDGQGAPEPTAALTLADGGVTAEPATVAPAITVTLALTATSSPDKTEIPPTAVPPTVPPTVAPPGGVPLTEQIAIPAGPFTMGSDGDTEGAAPARTVEVAGFLIDRTEVTNAQYAAFLNTYGNQEEGGVPWVDMADDENYLTQTGGGFQPIPGYENHPVIQVSWYGARAYCAAVGRRLPAEAEWEKAARGTDGRRYPWGAADAECSLANFWNGNAGGCVGAPVAVGSYAAGASPYGVLDMAGNVWEWVEDWYDPTAQDARVTRSGSFLDKADWATTFHRHRSLPVNQYAHTGFRCAQPSASSQTLPTSVPTASSMTQPPPTGIGTAGSSRVLPLLGGGELEQMGVPGGSFVMGDASGNDDERPAHTVYLDDFWLGRTEVTNAQFAAFAADTGYLTSAEGNGGGYGYGPNGWGLINDANWQHPQGPDSNINGLEDHPVVLVSWEDATAFCHWTGGRLPTEAEWEYAARGSDAPVYPWGNSLGGHRLNFCDANCPFDPPTADPSINDGYRFTAPAGNYPDGASWVGALDMAGNVWEWVSDWFADDYYAGSPSSNPLGPNGGAMRVLRGGSWSAYANTLRAANRDAGRPSAANADFGIRCAGD